MSQTAMNLKLEENIFRSFQPLVFNQNDLVIGVFDEISLNKINPHSRP